MALLRALLDDRESTTETRRVLAKALESDSRDIAWSAARLLCERGSFTASDLPDVLASKGLAHGDVTESEAARGWIAEILSRPRLVKEMRQALERAISRAVHASQHNRNYDLGWEAARCLVAAHAYEADYLAGALITAGFGQRSRHPEALAFLATVAASKAELAAEIETQLWKELRESEDDEMRWGTACAILDLFPDGVREMAASSMRLAMRGHARETRRNRRRSHARRSVDFSARSSTKRRMSTQRAGGSTRCSRRTQARRRATRLPSSFRGAGTPTTGRPRSSPRSACSRGMATP
jgi:hypothetical protein